MKAITTQILATHDMRINFTRCADLYRTFHRNLGGRKVTRTCHSNISPIGAKDNRAEEVEDCFYSTKEYTSFSEEQSKALRTLRSNRTKKGRISKDSDKKKMKCQSKRVANQQRELKALKSKLKKQDCKNSKLTTTAASNSESSSGDNDSSNCSNTHSVSRQGL